MKKITLFFIMVLLCSLLSAPAQQPWTNGQTLTNDSIVKLVGAGLGDDMIVSMVNTQPG